MFFKKKMPTVHYSNSSAEQVLKDVEIEVRRLIIAYQRQVLAPPPWENYCTNGPVQSDAAEETQTAETVESHVTEEPPMPTEKELDEIMPLPKKKKTIASLIGEEQIAVDEAIQEAEQQTDAKSETVIKVEATSSEPKKENVSQPTEKAPAQCAAEPKVPQREVLELTPAQRLSEKWLEFRAARFEAKTQRKALKRYYKSLNFQVKCNVEPLEMLLDFLHERMN